jgi:hypothetical protein
MRELLAFGGDATSGVDGRSWLDIYAVFCGNRLGTHRIELGVCPVQSEPELGIARWGTSSLCSQGPRRLHMFRFPSQLRACPWPTTAY